MYQVISEYMLQNFFKRLFVFACLFIAAIIIIYLHNSNMSCPSFDVNNDLNKTDLILTSLN